MRCYNYDPLTKEYRNFSDCVLDPLESNKTESQVWMLPANATFKEPPIPGDGKVAIWNGTSWELIDDLRGTEYWLPGDTWQTEPRVWKDLGPLPESAVTTRPGIPKEELDAQEQAAIRGRASAILMARMQADMVQTGAFAAAEFATFARAGLFTDWAAGQTYAKGYRLAHKGIVYEVMQEVTAIENQPPDASGMLAVYRPLSVDPETGEEPDGSKEHPYAFLYGMDVTKDSYYTYEGKLWLAKADMPACVWVPGTEGLWQWEEAGAAENAVYTPGVV